MVNAYEHERYWDNKVLVFKFFFSSFNRVSRAVETYQDWVKSHKLKYFSTDSRNVILFTPTGLRIEIVISQYEAQKIAYE